MDLSYCRAVPSFSNVFLGTRSVLRKINLIIYLCMHTTVISTNGIGVKGKGPNKETTSILINLKLSGNNNTLK